MIDIHCHIIPGVDDGARDIEEAIGIAIAARDNGIKTIVATPHYIEDFDYSTWEENKEVLENLNKTLADHEIHVNILQGSEIYITPEILRLLDKGDITTLNGSRYLLMELPMMEVPLYIDSIIYELRLKGIVPIIAHPERYRAVVENPNLLLKIIGMGALIQVNIPSLGGAYGEEIAHIARILLEHDMVHFLATDAHSPKGILKASKTLENVHGFIDEDRLERILYTNPKAIVENTGFDIPEPKEYIKKKIMVFGIGDGSSSHFGTRDGSSSQFCRKMQTVGNVHYVLMGS